MDECKPLVGGLTALAWAAKKGNCAALKPLIAAGADLNTRDDHGTTPVLHAAVAVGAVQVESSCDPSDSLKAPGLNP